MNMKLRFWKAMAGLLFGSVLGFSTSSHALSQLGQAPDPSVIISAGGLEWVWAAPCSPSQPSCGEVQLHHGFEVASEQDWLSSFLSLADIIDAFTNDNGGTICASPYFSTAHDHCDLGDLQIGAVFNLPASFGGQFVGSSQLESFLVRAEVPEPETLALLAFGLLGISALRKRASV